MSKSKIIQNAKKNAKINPIIREIILVGCKVEFGSLEDWEAEKEIIILINKFNISR